MLLMVRCRPWCSPSMSQRARPCMKLGGKSDPWVAFTRFGTFTGNRIGVLADGLRAVQDITRAITRIGKTEERHRAEYIRTLNAGPMDEYETAISLVTGKLVLYEFTDVTKKTNPFVLQLNNLWERAKE